MAATYRNAGARNVSRVAIAWTSDGAGAASVATKHLTGFIRRVVFDPGTAAPTDNYDAVLNDEHGVDLLAGQGADLDTANSSHVVPGVPFKDGTTVSVAPVFVDGILTLVIAAAGAAKEGVVYLYME